MRANSFIAPAFHALIGSPTSVRNQFFHTILLKRDQSHMSRSDLKPEHDLFIEHLNLQKTLRISMGEEVLDHSGLDYYEPDKAGKRGNGGDRTLGTSKIEEIQS